MKNYDVYAVYSVILFLSLYLVYLYPVSWALTFKLVKRADWNALVLDNKKLNDVNAQLRAGIMFKAEGAHKQIKFESVATEQPKEVRIPMVINGVKQVHVWRVADWEQRKKDKVFVRRNGKPVWVDDYEKGDEYWVENMGHTFWTKTLQAGDKITYPYRVEWDKPKTNGHKNGNGHKSAGYTSKYVNPRRLADKNKVGG